MKGVNFGRFTRYLFDTPPTARFAAQVVKALLTARCPRFRAIARRLPGRADSAYRRLQRFVQHTDPRQTLQRLFQAEAPFVIGDVTAMPRPEAWKTSLFVSGITFAKGRTLSSRDRFVALLGAAMGLVLFALLGCRWFFRD